MFVALVKTGSIAVLALFAASFLAAEPGLPPLTHGLTVIPPGISAPSMKLTNLDEEVTDLAEFRGDVVVVNFWAT